MEKESTQWTLKILAVKQFPQQKGVENCTVFPWTCMSLLTIYEKFPGYCLTVNTVIEKERRISVAFIGLKIALTNAPILPFHVMRLRLQFVRTPPPQAQAQFSCNAMKEIKTM